jgi:hypothetical protein
MIKQRVIITACIVLIFIIPSKRALAWGKVGHQMVAEVAFNYLDAATRAKVLAALKTYTIEQAATWMDDMRSNTAFDYQKPWHFVNIDKGKSYVQTKNDCAYQLNRVIVALQHKSTLPADTIQRDLLILFHLMGDMHQPLHVGYGSDRGGNDDAVVFPGETKDELHKVWDSDIIYNKHIAPADCIKVNSAYTPAQVAVIQNVNVITWLNQSRAYLPNAYNFTGKTITQPYIDANALIIEKQIGIAGLRLAGVLKAIFHA